MVDDPYAQDVGAVVGFGVGGVFPEVVMCVWVLGEGAEGLAGVAVLQGLAVGGVEQDGGEYFTGGVGGGSSKNVLFGGGHPVSEGWCPEGDI